MPFESVTDAVLVASIIGFGDISTMVGSFVVFPSLSSPSSEMSVTLFVCPGEEPVASTELETKAVLEVELFII